MTHSVTIDRRVTQIHIHKVTQLMDQELLNIMLVDFYLHLMVVRGFGSFCSRIDE